MTPQTPVQDFERLLDDSLAALANPPASPGFPAQLSRRILAAAPPVSGSPAPRPVLVFHSIAPREGRAISRTSLALAALANLAAAIPLFLGARAYIVAPRPPAAIVTLSSPAALKAPPHAQTAAGGGGQHDRTPVAHGNPPRFAPAQLNPPKAPPLQQPKINIPVTVDVDRNIHMATTALPTFGLPTSPLIGAGLGAGRGAGLGSGTGGGLGSGAGGNVGGGIRRVGGTVSAPVVLYHPEAEFSEEARKAKVSGNVLVYLQVDPLGRPTHVRVLRGIGLGLDEKALEAVRQYRFKPAMENGRPVTVEMNVDVTFNIY